MTALMTPACDEKEPAACEHKAALSRQVVSACCSKAMTLLIVPLSRTTACDPEGPFGIGGDFDIGIDEGVGKSIGG